MIHGIYPKIFLWFCFATAMMGGSVFLITVAIHSQSLGPRWMTGVLNQYARSAVQLYVHGGKAELEEYLEEIERSSRMRATLLDPQSVDILRRGVPRGAEDVLIEARNTGQSQFRTGFRWRGASVVSTPEGNFILVARVLPLQGFWSWSGLRTPVLRLTIALLSGGIFCLMLARHIAAPIRALQTVAGRIADGDLSVRTTPAISARNDELADLARDFDRMADCVQSLVQKQQELLGDISHELRSPLTRLNVSLELLRRGEADAIQRMQADLNRLDALIGQILTLTRLQADGAHYVETMVNLRTILESVAEDARFEGKEQEKSVVIAHADDCWLKGDPALLRSCVENVVRNAVRHTKTQTDVVLQLNVSAVDDLSSARILVADYGDGVPPESLPRLFEPFYHVSESRDRLSGGSGLGLSIAQRIVLLHGGSISAHNREGGGLEMEICFPIGGLNVAIPPNLGLGAGSTLRR
jgi:two-component system sensor histidine kinase CpxA